MKIQTIKTFITNNLPGSSIGMAESVLRERGFLLTTQSTDHVGSSALAKPKQLAQTAVMEFEGLAPDLEGITDIVYQYVPETKEYYGSVIVFYKKESE